MAKTIEQKIQNSTIYKTIIGDRELTDSEKYELQSFVEIYPFTHDRITTIVRFIKQGHSNWATHFNTIKTLSSCSKQGQILLYGEEDGLVRYHNMNQRKTKGFDHSSEEQRRKGVIAGNKLRGSKEYSVRSIGYWMKNGLSEKEAKEKVNEIQATNTIARYIKKHGEIEGPIKFANRNAVWTKIMSDPVIGKKRSLGLARYIERYGEIEGKRNYINMRAARNAGARGALGRASKESLTIFTPLLSLLNSKNIQYYLGVENNRDWFIYDNYTERPYFYDLTIPSKSLIIEYHGEMYHPNPDWSAEKLALWTCLFSNKSAVEVFTSDAYKRKIAKDAGWNLIEIYASDTSMRIQEAMFVITGDAL